MRCIDEFRMNPVVNGFMDDSHRSSSGWSHRSLPEKSHNRYRVLQSAESENSDTNLICYFTNRAIFFKNSYIQILCHKLISNKFSTLMYFGEESGNLEL